MPRSSDPATSLRNSSSVKARRTRFCLPRSSALDTFFNGLALILPTRSIQFSSEIIPCRYPLLHRHIANAVTQIIRPCFLNLAIPAEPPFFNGEDHVVPFIIICWFLDIFGGMKMAGSAMCDKPPPSSIPTGLPLSAQGWPDSERAYPGSSHLSSTTLKAEIFKLKIIGHLPACLVFGVSWRYV